MTVAVSTNASGPLSKSAPKVSTTMPGGRSANCSTPGPFCRLINVTPGIRPSGAKAFSGIERPLSIGASGLPCQAMPTRKVRAGNRLDQRSTRVGSAERYGISPAPCSGAQPRTNGTLINGRCRSKFGGCSPSGTMMAPQSRRCIRAPSRACTSRITLAPGHRSGEAGELDRVAETLLCVEQHPLARYVLPRPFRPIECSLTPLLCCSARFVFAPAIGERAEQQQQQPPVETMISIARAELECPVQTRQRLVQPLQLPKRLAAVVQRMRVVATDGQRPVIARQRLLKTIQLPQRDTAVVQRFGVVGPDRQCQVIARQRLLEALELPQYNAAVVERVSVFGPVRQRPIVARQRLVEALQLQKGNAAVVERLAIVGPDRQGSIVARQRLLEALAMPQYIAAAVERLGIVGSDRQRLVIAGQRFLEAAQFRQRIATIVERLGIVGPDRQRPLIACQSLLLAA